MNFTSPRSGHLSLTIAAIVAAIVASSVVHPSEPARAAEVPVENRDADDSYSYPVTVPAGNVLATTPDGGAQIVDEEGVVKVSFEPAWAKDATGKSIPTRYTVSGNVLTQIVDHRETSDVTYPVVADPLPVILIVVTAAAAIIVAAAALGIATWIVINWWNYCRARGKYPQLSTRGGFTARCVS